MTNSNNNHDDNQPPKDYDFNQSNHTQSNADSSTSLAKVFLLFGALIGLSTWWFSDYFDKKNNPNRNAQVSNIEGQEQLTLRQSPSGHYLVSGSINDNNATLLLDTGATFVSVPLELAEKANMKKTGKTTLSTANGLVEAWYGRIDKLEFAGMLFFDVPAVINPGRQEGVLLGMSVLKHLELNQKDGILVITK
jgi:aspartyl protease family protein